MIKIAIKGHPTRGIEIIKILKSLGGNNTYITFGDNPSSYYYITVNNNISYIPISLLKRSEYKDFKLYTLEEFEKEFPFKIGDKVTIIGLSDSPKIITQIKWNCGEILYSFENLMYTWYSAKSLKIFKMKEERNITLTLDKAKEWYKKGGELKEVALQAYSEEELNKVGLPKTWKEFCSDYRLKEGECYINNESSILETYELRIKRDAEQDRNVCPSQKSAEAHLALIQLEQLRDCWRQGWEPTLEKDTYSIKTYRKRLGVFCYCTSEFLSFPTRKMAEEFLECFIDLIEKAGDLI